MINADKSGVMFTVHPATGEKEKLIIEAGWGLGEGVVSGAVTPDHYVVDKNTGEVTDKEVMRKEIMFVRSSRAGGTEKRKVPEDKAEKQVLTEAEIKKLADLGKLVEKHYEFPQDIEWAIEGDELYLLQSRPITVFYEEEKAEEEGAKKDVLIKGLAASPGLGSGRVKIIFSTDELDKVKEGDVLVTPMTNPDMVPAMRRASAIVTEEGGMTCHAAIVSRELGIPCIVGTSEATKVLSDGDEITVDGSRGVVYKGLTEKKDEKLQEVMQVAPQKIVTATEVKANISIPEIAPRMAPIADGVGLLRVEHMILGIGKHPIKFIHEGKEEELIEKLAEGVRAVAEAFYPKPVWYRSLDAPTDEFRSLEGGEEEPVEHNPMLGWRGIRRGLDQEELLRAEFRAIKKLVDEGFTNIGTMIPLVIRPEELRRAKEIALEVGLKPHEELKFGIMVETPASALIIEDFIAEGLDFISFGTNDLTQYTLALDRNNEHVAKLFSEKHKAVLKLIEMVIKKCRKAGVETSICGQAGSYPDVVEKLVRFGITSVSANPDAVELVRETVARTEKRLLLDKARGT
jgi:pyruvate,water dikinase